jgi:hypothetical protein
MRYSAKVLLYVVCRNWIKLAVCKTIGHQQVVGKFQLYNNGRAISLILFIRDSVKSIWV